MQWLMRFLHLNGRTVPAHIQEALDVNEVAKAASEEAKAVVDLYWDARRKALLDEYDHAERQIRDR